MSTDRTPADLALPRWRMGQVLLPAQFEALQTALLRQMGAWQAASGLPAYGVAHLSLNLPLLAAGAVAIDALAVAFPDGTYVDVPGNAVLSNLNLADAKAKSVEVFLHVCPPEADDSPTAQPAGTEKAVAEEIERVRWRLALALTSRVEGALQSLKLFELQQDLEKRWVRGKFTPPLLQVGSSPYLDDDLGNLLAILDELDAQLRWLLFDSYLRGDRRYSVQRAQAASFRMRMILDDVTGELRHHPFVVYDALRVLYLELCLQKDVAAEAVPAYRHDDLAGCYGEIVESIAQKASAPATSLARVTFARDDERMTATPLTQELARASDVYLVIESPPGQRSVLEGAKLAARSRLRIVYTNALTGVYFEPVKDERLRAHFGAGVEMYRIHRGDEWSYALAEGALSFYAAGIEPGSAALFWSGN